MRLQETLQAPKSRRTRAPELLKPTPKDRPKVGAFHRGRTFPRAIAWFGLKSFWGHLWHLAASVIATEDIDSRDWMMPESSADFTRRVALQLGAALDSASVTSSIERDLWFDYIADTGDDADVSRAVVEMLFADHAWEDLEGQTIVLPRGDLLIFGGDTAYPVATDLEIHNRVTVPFNRVLRERHDGKRRVLLGIPGNHDWYAGLDGFGRMFRERRGSVDRASLLAADEIDEAGQIGHLIEWIEAFRVGARVRKRPALPLEGYTTVQTASYWALELAPNLQVWGVDRQLREVDFRQQNYFAEARQRGPEDGFFVLMPDPAYAYLEPYAIGQEILGALETRIEDGHLVMSGDTHHYTRLALGKGMHITAGGGGAFLHPTRVSRRDVLSPQAEFPGPNASRALILTAPLRLGSGRSGVIVHVALALTYLPIFFHGGQASAAVHWGTAAVVSVACLLLAGWRKKRALGIGVSSVLAGLAIGWLPRVLWLGLSAVGAHALPSAVLQATWALLSLVVGATLFGTFLMFLFLLGLEHNQAAGTLAHPGYKHFVRLRARQDGSVVEGWVIGKIDPLDANETPCLVDHFLWKNPGAEG